MRLVFINYTHPAHPHISGVRVRRFADEMSARGHRVVLLTRNLRDEPSSPDLPALAGALEAHDWATPLHLACAPRPMPLLEASRGGGGVGHASRLEKGTTQPGAAGRLIRKACLVYHYLIHGGVFTDWVRGAMPYWPLLAETFRPDATWGTFGNPEALWIGKGLAERAGAAWCVDIKDNPDNYLPLLIRRWMVGRMARARLVTSNSVFHGERFRHWSGRPPVVVYSGYQPVPEGVPAGPDDPLARSVFVGGSIYGKREFGLLVKGLQAWWEANPGKRAGFGFVYAGGDRDRVKALLEELRPSFPVRAEGYLPQPQFADWCAKAGLNAYIWAPHTFHHKVVDLLAAGRPVLAVPGDHAESFEIARNAGGRLAAAGSVEAIVSHLDQVFSSNPTAGRSLPPRMDLYSWKSQADILERELLRTVQSKGGKL